LTSFLRREQREFYCRAIQTLLLATILSYLFCQPIHAFAYRPSRSSFYNNPTSDTKNIQSIHSINVKTINNRLVINSIHAGKIFILDSSGKIIYQKTVKFGTSEIKIENQGIYLIVFEADNGNKFSQKIIIN